MGDTVSFGRGSVTGIEKKQNINAKISTEAELIGADNSMPQMLWTRYLIEAQSFTVEKNVLLWDKLSSVLLDRNGMEYISNWTKHIRVRCYSINDPISEGDIVVKHFPTGIMLADHFTKPLQGALYQKIRSEIQGITTMMNNKEMCWGTPGSFNMVPEATNTATSNPIPQESVGKGLNYDILTGSSRITGDKNGLEIEFCRGTKNRIVCNRLETHYCTNKYVRNIC